MSYRLLFLTCLMLAPITGKANCIGPVHPTDTGIGIYFDQDMFVPGTNEDRDYTMGIGVEVFQDQGPLYVLGDLMRWLEPMVGLDRRCGRVFRSFMLGALAYTPDDIGNPNPINDDRPYASLLFLANKKVVADDKRALGLEFAVGALGLKIAREVQTTLHDFYREQANEPEPVNPAGWQHQISDGGEPTARLRVADARRFARGRYWDLARSWDLNLGFQTNASVGLSGRVGQLNSPFWSMPYDPINRGNFVPASIGDEIYLWAAGRVRAIGYDVLLQGQFRDSAVTVDYDDMRKLVWEAGIGLTGSWSGTQFTFSVNGKAGDTRLPDAPDNHFWGGLYLSRNYR